MNPNNSLHILFASRLVEEKWVDILIQAIEKTSAHPIFSEQISWTIASDGLYESKIRELAEKNPSVQYLGKIPQERLASLYRESDILFMPSRFLETFGLTALESLACGTPVVGFRKGWLAAFVPEELALDPNDPVDSFIEILEKYRNERIPLTDVSPYNQKTWIESLDALFKDYHKILLIHDYADRIGWAEYYVEWVSQSLRSLGREVEVFSYSWVTTLWKRRIMFIFSIFAFWREARLSRMLEKTRPDALWMHSILRYVWPWGISAVGKYVRKYPNTRVYLSHHDVGLMAPFPQYITLESEIPQSAALFSFLSWQSFVRRLVAMPKWFYIKLISFLLPHSTEHVVFSSFLEKHVQAHFPHAKIRVFPHSYDEKVFHP